MKDELSFPGFTHDSIAGYCNDKPLWAQYRNDKKSKYIGTKQLWQELSKTQHALAVAIERLEQIAHESFQGDQQSINMGFHIRAAAALTDIEQITSLKQKD